MKHEEVLEFIDNSFDSKKSLSDITENIVNEVIDYRNGKDNVSVVLITLPYTPKNKN
jgi:serine/threonine protein phosphatase PrpC